MSITAAQKNKYNIKFTKWISEHFSGIEFTVDDVMDKFNSDKTRIAFPTVKQPKDPNAPKKALSGYLLFSESIRKKVKEENPDKKMTELSKIIGQQWSSLSDNKKLKFKKESLKNKEEYNKKMKEYNKLCSFEDFINFHGPKGQEMLNEYTKSLEKDEEEE